MSVARAVVRHNVSAMRAEPHDGSERVSEAIFGETVTLLEDEGDYSRIQTPDGYRGWVSVSHLAVLETGEQYPDPARAALVTPLILPALARPSGCAERITLLTLGTVVQVAGEASGFAEIDLPGGGKAFVESGALIVPEYPEPEHLGANAAVIARGLIGAPYLWGGRTPFGIDCSGFVQRVFWLCGRTLPRDAYLQATVPDVLTVAREDVRAGDLLFFCSDRDPRGRGITHVGIALGDGRFIHASADDGVTITPLDHPRYVREFRNAGRLNGENRGRS